MNANLKTRLSLDTLEAREVPTVVPINWHFGDPSPQPSRPLQLGRPPELVGFTPIPIEIQPFRPQLPLPPLPKPGAPDPWVVRLTLVEGKTVSPDLLARLRATVSPAPITPAFGKGAFFG